MYVRWVQKLATKEYADELVVLCVALELGIRIKIIPYTPPTAIGTWAVATYGREDAEHVLHLGNNDAHYVYLSQDSTQDSTEVVATPERHSKDPLSKDWSEERQRKVRRLMSEPVCEDK